MIRWNVIFVPNLCLRHIIRSNGGALAYFFSFYIFVWKDVDWSNFIISIANERRFLFVAEISANKNYIFSNYPADFRKY